MTTPRDNAPPRSDPDIEPGLGTPCPESQADGVPCRDPASDCRDCPLAG